MAFSSTGLALLHNPFSSPGVKHWVYRSPDDHATVEGTGYFADGERLGLAVGDLVTVMRYSTADGSSAATCHVVSASTAAVSAASPLPASAFNQALNATITAAST